jgi:hypothetical protein
MSAPHARKEPSCGGLKISGWATIETKFTLSPKVMEESALFGATLTGRLNRLIPPIRWETV